MFGVHQGIQCMPHTHHFSCVIHTIWKGSMITTNLHILYMIVSADWELTLILKYFCLVDYTHLLGLFHLFIYFLLNLCEAWFLRLWKLPSLTLSSCLSSHLTKGHYSSVDICRYIGAKNGWISLPSFLLHVNFFQNKKKHQFSLFSIDHESKKKAQKHGRTKIHHSTNSYKTPDLQFPHIPFKSVMRKEHCGMWKRNRNYLHLWNKIIFLNL